MGCLGGNFPAVIELLKTKKVSTENIVSHRFGLDQAAEAFRAQLQDPAAVKVMIMPQER